LENGVFCCAFCVVGNGFIRSVCGMNKCLFQGGHIICAPTGVVHICINSFILILRRQTHEKQICRGGFPCPPFCMERGIIKGGRLRPMAKRYRLFFFESLHRLRRSPPFRQGGETRQVPALQGLQIKQRKAGASLYFSLGLNIRAITRPKTMATVMPPAVAVRPPVKMPKKPCSFTAFITPLQRA